MSSWVASKARFPVICNFHMIFFSGHNGLVPLNFSWHEIFFGKLYNVVIMTPQHLSSSIDNTGGEFTQSTPILRVVYHFLLCSDWKLDYSLLHENLRKKIIQHEYIEMHFWARKNCLVMQRNWVWAAKILNNKAWNSLLQS